MRIEIFGMGCDRCTELERNFREAVRRLGIEAEFVKVADAAAIAANGGPCPVGAGERIAVVEAEVLR